MAGDEGFDNVEEHLCKVCTAATTVFRNVIARHHVPATKFSCPASGTPVDLRAATIDGSGSNRVGGTT
jgi:hypothetical protein